MLEFENQCSKGKNRMKSEGYVREPDQGCEGRRGKVRGKGDSNVKVAGDQ